MPQVVGWAFSGKLESFNQEAGSQTSICTQTKPALELQRR